MLRIIYYVLLTVAVIGQSALIASALWLTFDRRRSEDSEPQ